MSNDTDLFALRLYDSTLKWRPSVERRVMSAAGSV